MVVEEEAHQEGVMVEAVDMEEDARNRIMEAFWFAISLLIAGNLFHQLPLSCIFFFFFCCV